MAGTNPPVPPPPPNPDPEALALFGPRPEGLPADAPWPPPDMELMGDSGIRDSALVDSGFGETTVEPPAVPAPPGVADSALAPQNPVVPVPADVGAGLETRATPGEAPAPPEPRAPDPSVPENPEPTTQNPPPVAGIRDSGFVDSGAATPAFPFPAGLGAVHELDPASLPIHPYANLLPLMSEAEYRRLRDAIALDGQQVPAQVYAGQLLDGRNRARACQELGIPLKVEAFVGTDQSALTYVLSVNQHRRELDKSQRAVVAASLRQLISAEVNRKRIEKLRATLHRKQAGESMTLVSDTQDGVPEAVLARNVAADIMGVSGVYVQMAIQLQTASPDMFEQVRAGRITLKAALRQVQGTASAGLSTEARALRQRVTALLRDPARTRDFSTRLNQLVKEFEGQ